MGLSLHITHPWISLSLPSLMFGCFDYHLLFGCRISSFLSVLDNVFFRPIINNLGSRMGRAAGDVAILKQKHFFVAVVFVSILLGMKQVLCSQQLTFPQSIWCQQPGMLSGTEHRGRGAGRKRACG